VAIKRMRGPYATLPRPFAAPALSGLSDNEVLDWLTVEHLSRAAYWRLWEGAMTDNSPVRGGLRHTDPRVRAACAQILDRFLDDAALAEIVDCLCDDHPRVRVWALHTLGCDRCKEGSCRPGEDVFLPEAIRMLREDPTQACGRRRPPRLASRRRLAVRMRQKRSRPHATATPRPPRPQGRRPFREGTEARRASTRSGSMHEDGYVYGFVCRIRAE
jgi:hypothetical protein